MGRAQGLAVGLALAAVLIGAGLAVIGSPAPAPSVEPTPAAPSTTRAVFPVYVSGWVVNPGVVEVAGGSIVADALAAAGGALEGALLDTINLARPLADGDHVQIPGPGEPAAAIPTEGDGGVISLNRADPTELEDLPGVGPVLAERIVAYREANGPFETVEDLLDVPGIGEAKLASIRDLVVP